MLKRGATAAVVAACAVAASAIVVVGACIPDLPPPQPPVERCGDGIIDLDAGEQCDPGPGAGEGGIAGCSSMCQVQCEGGLTWPGNNHCYQVVSQGALALQSAAGSASSLCQQRSGHVVTFASDDELQAVESLDAGIFWVGLMFDHANAGVTAYKPVDPSLAEPGWSQACSGCYASTADAMAPLPEFGDASPDASPTLCIVATPSTTASWRQYPCNVGYLTTRLPAPRVVCEREPVGRLSTECDAGICIDLVATHGAKRYVYVQDQVTADQARQACAAMAGRLVVLRSRDEREQLWRELSHLAAPPPAVWIGLSEVSTTTVTIYRRRTPTLAWLWDNGQPVAAYPSEWGNGQPLSRTPGATVSTRAYLWQQPNEDDTLAHTEATFQTLPYVCEITADTLAAAADAGVDAAAD